MIPLIPLSRELFAGGRVLEGHIETYSINYAETASGICLQTSGNVCYIHPTLFAHYNPHKRLGAHVRVSLVDGDLQMEVKNSSLGSDGWEHAELVTAEPMEIVHKPFDLVLHFISEIVSGGKFCHRNEDCISTSDLRIPLYYGNAVWLHEKFGEHSPIFVCGECFEESFRGHPDFFSELVILDGRCLLDLAPVPMRASLPE